MKHLILLFLVQLILALIPQQVMATPSHCKILVAEDVLNRYLSIKDQVGLEQPDSDLFLDQGRDVVDLMVLIEALRLGGFEHSLEFVSNGIYQRNLHLLLKQDFLMSADSFWLSDINSYEDNLRISQAVIEDGQYDAGLYTSKQNLKALSTQNIAGIRQLTAASNRFWTADWEALNELNPQRLDHVNTWFHMFKTVQSKMADFTLVHFRNTPTMEVSSNGITLVPIPNVKVVLKDSRHFAIASHHPLADEAFSALERGLTKIKESGILVPAYQRVGINMPHTRQWTVLNSK